MAKKITKYSLFLASPGDLEEERLEAENIIKELNLTYGNQQNLVLELIKWETHSAPGITSSSIQNIINEDIGSEYDLFIGIIWKKFGTKTAIANSGTEEEFLNALTRFNNKSNVQILFYFKNSTPKHLEDIDPMELSKVNSFKAVLKEKEVFYWAFNTIDEFKTHLRIHIPKRIETIKSKGGPIQEEQTIDKEKEIKDDEELIIEDDFGSFDYLIDFENLLTKATKALNNISESTSEIGNDFNKKTEEINKVSNYPNPNNQLMLEVFKSISKTMNSYSQRLKTETPIFYENFEEALNKGLKYMNLMALGDKEAYRTDLMATLKSIEGLQESIPSSINGMKSLHSVIKSLPRIQSDMNASKRQLDIRLQELIDKLESAYKLTSEFINEIEYKLSQFPPTP